MSLAASVGGLDIGTVALLAAGVVASLFTAWTIGAGSSGATPFAPAVGANAITVLRAGALVGVLGFLGAVLQGANVTETIGGELIGGAALTPLAATVALLIAATLIAIGVFTGYPIATAFAVSGAVVGAGLTPSVGGTPAWAVYAEIVALWVLTPPVGVATAYLTARTLRSERVPEHASVPVLAALVGAIVANMGFSLLGGPDEAASIAEVVTRAVAGPSVVATVDPAFLGAAGAPGGSITLTAASLAHGGTTLGVAVVLGAWVGRATVADPERAQQRFLLALGALVAFSAGGGKVGLAIGPLLPLLGGLPMDVPLVYVLTFGGVGLLVGSWMAAPRMIKALAQDYSELGPRRAIAALIPAFAIAQVAIALGLPMSFNEIFISSIAGSGLAAGRAGVSPEKLAKTGAAWIASLLIASVGSYAVVRAIGAIL